MKFKIFDEKNSVSGITEKDLILRICKGFGSAMPKYPKGAGDDCAVFSSKEVSKNLCATCDPVIFGVHFNEECPPAKVGAKLVKRNLSDLAAMGAKPHSALMAATFSKNISKKWLDEFCGGIGFAAKKYGLKILGGDVSCVKESFFSCTMSLLGSVSEKPMLRRFAKLGDFIYTTGDLGLSFESAHHLNFEPRLKEGEFFAKSKKISACTDLSDGIASDVKNILKPSHALLIDFLPLRKFKKMSASVKKALSDGEDYELLIAIPKSDALAMEKSFFKKFKTPLMKIGEVVKSKSGEKIFMNLPDFPKGGYEGEGFSHL